MEDLALKKIEEERLAAHHIRIPLGHSLSESALLPGHFDTRHSTLPNDEDAPLAVVTCPVCHFEAKADSMFCRKCGADIRPPKEAPCPEEKSESPGDAEAAPGTSPGPEARGGGDAASAPRGRLSVTKLQ